jgi:ABC-type transport system involved in multi-copper enzyme maturation permease subunit
MSEFAADRPPSPIGASLRVDPGGSRIGEAIGMSAWFFAAAGWFAWLWRADWAVGPLHLAVAVVLILALAYLARRGWVRLFGPVLFYEGLRAARRSRFFLLRWLYAIGLLLLLLWVHSIWSLERHYSATNVNMYKQQAKLAEEFFYAFAAVQFATVVLLAPAYVAGGVAEEKEKRTLEFLLATDLRGREIVFGKLLARLGNLALFVMTGLPVLSLMQFFGGIDPQLLLSSFAVTALTAGSLAGLGTLMSVQRRRARDAIILTYLLAAGYVAVASLSLAVPPLWLTYFREAQRAPVKDDAIARASTPPYFTEVETAVDWLNAGNPFYGLGRIIRAVDSGGKVTDVLPELLENYAVFHLLFTAGCVTFAVWRLRPVALAQAGAAARKRRRRFQLRRSRRPPVGRRPMLWKEVRIEGGLRFGWFGRILVALVVGISFVPFIIMVYLLFFDPSLGRINYTGAWRELGRDVNIWVRFASTPISVLMLFGVAVRAAGAFGSERDRDTLTSLMTTPLTTGEIVWAKFLGSLASVRLFWVWLGVIWAIGLITSGVGMFAVPLQIVAWLCPAAFMGALGLYFSAVCKTTLRAITWTILLSLFALGGHWVCMGMCCFAPLEAMGVHGQSMDWVYELEAGLSPPFLFAALPAQDISELFKDWYGEFPALTMLAQVIWLVAAAVVGHLAHDRFRRLTNRVDRRRAPPAPDRQPQLVMPAD